MALSGCPGIYSVDQSGLRLRDLPASALGELGLKVYTTMLVCTHIHPLEKVILNRFLSLQTCSQILALNVTLMDIYILN